MSDFFSLPVVCNTGLIIALSRVGLGHLLVKLFPKVLTTREVVAELTAKDAGDTPVVAETLASLEILPTPRRDPLLEMEIDPGEASVILLARELGIKGVLIDDRLGRRVARDVYGLEVRGICAVLLRAKKLSLIAEVSPKLDDIIANKYFIGRTLRFECLRLAGE